MRILSIATTHPRFRGDAEPAYVERINRELSRLGHRVTTLLPHAPSARSLEVVEGVRIRRFRYFRPERLQRLCYDGGMLPNLRRGWWPRINLPFFLLAQAAAVRREIRSGDHELVHCHWLLPSGFMAALFKGGDVPLVVTAHGSDVFVDSRLFRRLNRFVLERSDLCTANSTGSRLMVESIRDDAAVEILPMGVDVAAFRPERASRKARIRLGGGEPQLLFVGRFSEHKGLPVLVEAMPRLLEALPSARLAIVGFGPEERALRGLVSARGLEHAVCFVGRVAGSEMPAVMASADLLVLPSIRIEGLGLVLLEALASGTAVVGTAVGGIPDVIRPLETGLLCREGDAEDLARACITLLTDDALRARTAANGRRLVEERFSWGAIAAGADRLFRRIVEDHPGNRRGARAGGA